MLRFRHPDGFDQLRYLLEFVASPFSQRRDEEIVSQLVVPITRRLRQRPSNNDPALVDSGDETKLFIEDEDQVVESFRLRRIAGRFEEFFSCPARPLDL